MLQTVVELFEAQVKLHPTNKAVVYLNKSLTYKEINEKAKHVANHLIELGAGPGKIVGIYLERSIEMVIATFGVLKTGAAYLPIDTYQPIDIINYILNDSDVEILLTESTSLNSVAIRNNLHLIFLDKFEYTRSFLNCFENSKHLTSLDDIAYVIYTSGTTGKPKGVIIKHSNLANAYLAWEAVYQLDSMSAIHLQMAKFSFDVFTGDLVRALCAGGTLVLCPENILLNPELLFNFMKNEHINCAEFVPAVLRRLIDYLKKNNQCLNFIKLLICGSDSWTVGEYKQFKSFCGKNTRLINSYGMTEATIDSTYFEEENINLSDESLVPIGRPFPGTKVYILDGKLQPVNEGEIGEIYISGKGVGHGYLNKVDLTKEKFLSNPFCRDKINEKLYKTGDLGRLLPDNNIQFMGRVDTQIKINGYRVELEAIEATLNALPGVTGCIVLPRSGRGGYISLVAFLVCNVDLLPNKREIEEILRKQLPYYMIPHEYRQIASIPLTFNGKMNRNYSLSGDLIYQSYLQTSKTSIEKKLLKLLKNVLVTKKFDASTNFYMLGLDSFLCANFSALISKELNIEIKVCEIFGASTIKCLALLVEEKLKEKV